MVASMFAPASSLSGWVTQRVREHQPLVTLRDYQDDAITSVANAVERDGKRRVIVVLPTGAGKTLVFGELARGWLADGMGRVLVLAHRDELLTQAIAKLSLMVPRHLIGLVKANSNQVDAPIVVASVQTLDRPHRLAQIGQFGLIIIDESHHAAADSYHRILTELGAFEPSGPVVVGVTATPKRADGVALDSVFQDIVYRKTYTDMMAAGYLVPVVSKAFDLIPHAAKVGRGVDGDFAEGALGKLMLGANAPDKIVEAWRDHGERRKTLVFTPTVSVAKAVAAAFQDANVPAAWVSGAQALTDRRQALADLAAGRVQVVANCAALSEGFDEPSVSCVIIGRPTMNESLYIQMVGRGTRLHPESGKRDCIAEGERVLTDHGLVPIEQVTTAMKVWDGICFTSHCGVILRGSQEVISYAGLTATPDHRVWTDGGWKSFGQCAADGTPIRVTGDGGNPLREADRYRRGPGHEGSQADADGPMCYLRSGGAAATGQSTARSSGLPRVRSSKNCAEVVVAAGDVSEATLYEPEGPIVLQVRRQGDRVPISIPNRDGTLGSGESWPASRDGDRPYRQQRPLRARQPEVHDARSEHRELASTAGQCAVSRLQVEVPGGQVRGRDAARLLTAGHDADTDRGEVLPAVSKTKRRVWDILNAGPRHRFTVEGLLVSNCLVLDMVGCVDQLHLDAVIELGGRGGRARGESDRELEPRTYEDVAFETMAGQLVGRTVQAAKSACRWVTLTDGWFALSMLSEGWVVLKPSDDGTWAVHRWSKGARKPSTEHEGLSLDWAKAAGEGVARNAGAFGAMTRRASWLDRPLSEKAFAFAQRSGFPITAETTAWQFTQMQAEKAFARWRT